MPPRPRYPSDRKDYHKRRNPDWAHSVRIPEDCRFFALKDALSSSMADTIRFIIDAVDTAIQLFLETRAARVIPDSQAQDCPMFFASAGVQSLTDSEEDHSGSEDGETDIDENVMEEVGAECFEVQPNEERVIWDFTLVEDSQAPGESTNTNHSSEGPAIDTNVGVGSEGPQVDENVGVGNQDPASMALELGIHVPRSQHFYDFQAGRGREIGWIRAALDLWESSKRDIQDRLVESGGKQQWPCCGNE
ncbi:hypothetical protein R1sor_013340 [Riccia sorocarpa]|uniref:Uncharacterized protein n=1 Tax=Riccia sorocarpa TaxID=122646 RepID=A0ABD3H899_9MARC